MFVFQRKIRKKREAENASPTRCDFFLGCLDTLKYQINYSEEKKVMEKNVLSMRCILEDRG